MSQMSQIRSLYRALFRHSANIYVLKLRFAVVWLGQIHNLDTGHVYVLGLKSDSERLSDGDGHCGIDSIQCIRKIHLLNSNIQF